MRQGCTEARYRKVGSGTEHLWGLFSYSSTGNLINETDMLEQGRNVPEQAKDWQLLVLPVRASYPFLVHSQLAMPA